MRSIAARCPAAASRAPSGPKRDMSFSYETSRASVRCAVVLPVSPLPMRRASTTATRRPERASNSAAVIPVMPPPTTATSTATFPARGAYGGAGVASDQTELV